MQLISSVPSTSTLSTNLVPSSSDDSDYPIPDFGNSLNVPGASSLPSVTENFFGEKINMQTTNAQQRNFKVRRQISKSYGTVQVFFLKLFFFLFLVNSKKLNYFQTNL